MNKKISFVGLLLLVIFSAHAFENFDAAMTAGKKADAQKKFAESTKIFDIAVKLATTQQQKFDAAVYAAESLKKSAEFTAALSRLTPFLADEKKLDAHNQARLHLFLGDIYREQKEWQQANAEYEQVIKIGTKSYLNSMALIRLGEKKLAEKDYAAAEKYFHEVTDNPETISAHRISGYVYLSNCSLAQSKYDEALDSLNEAGSIEKITPDQKAQLLIQRVYVITRKKDYNEAITLCESIFSINGISPVWEARANSQLAYIYFHHLKNKEKAKEFIDKAGMVKEGEAGIDKILKAKINESAGI